MGLLSHRGAYEEYVTGYMFVIDAEDGKRCASAFRRMFESVVV